MIYGMVKLALFPLYLVMFIILVLIGATMYSLMFFYLGPFAPFMGILYGTSWAFQQITGQGKKKR